MKAVVIPENGGPEVMTVEEVPDPVAGEGEVLIDVAAAGVNRADVLQRQGLYRPPAGASPILGLECAGTIAALGPGVSGFQVGDRVCALLSGGGYAERVAVPVGQVLPVPGDLDVVTAAGLPETVCTVWSNVFRLAGLRTDEVLLVHGGGSGIGTTAVQLASAFGARVLVTVGSQEKAQRCLELGADVAIDYRTQDFPTVCKEATDGRGVDVILDVVGAAYLGRNLDALATSGRLVVIGMQKGRKAELDLGLLLAKQAAVFGTLLRARSVEEKAAIVASVREHVWPLVEQGRVRPIVDRVVDLDQAAEAHRRMENSEHFGKLILRVSG